MMDPSDIIVAPPGSERHNGTSRMGPFERPERR